MGHCVTVMWVSAVGLVFCTQLARPSSNHSLAYQDLLYKIRVGDAPKLPVASQQDWAYNSQTAAFEKALKEGNNGLGY